MRYAELKKEQELNEKMRPTFEMLEQQQDKETFDEFFDELLKNNPDMQGKEDELLELIVQGKNAEDIVDLVRAKQVGNLENFKSNILEELKKDTSVYDEKLNDDEYLSKLAENPKIKELVLKQHIKGVKDNQPPNLITDKAGTAIATPEKKPTTFEEAGQAFLASLGN
jgi:hypothetical protein